MIPIEIQSPQDAYFTEILWEDGRYAYPHWVLRGFCPCAHCQGHQGPIVFRECDIDGDHVLIQSLSEVGHYALNIHWKDGHNTGIYHFAMLYELGKHLQAHVPFTIEAARTIAFSRS